MLHEQRAARQSTFGVLLVERSIELRRRVRMALTEVDRLELIGWTDTEQEAVKLAQMHAVDIVILDLHLKQGTGLGVMKTLAVRGMSPTIIVLTHHDATRSRMSAAALGADYVLDKACDISRLARALSDASRHHEHRRSI